MLNLNFRSSYLLCFYIHLDYLCSPDANIYDIDFVRFKIRDLETGTVLFEIAKPSVPPGKIKYLIACFISFCTLLSFFICNVKTVLSVKLYDICTFFEFISLVLYVH